MRMAGVFNGTGADVTLCIGFIPDYVTLWNLQGTQGIKLVWNKGMQRATEVVEGIHFTGSDVTASALTKGNGILSYYGGITLASADVGTTTYGSTNAVYLKPDYFDYRRVTDVATGIVGDAVSTLLDTWTLTNASNYTGKFNSNVNGTYIGAGSSININGKTYAIVGLSNDGDADDDVTLSHLAKSGTIHAIHGMYDYKPMVAGEVSKDGFLISDSTVNVSAAQIAFEAGQYDR